MTICNCNQGRLPCTCRSFEQMKMSNDSECTLEAGQSLFSCPHCVRRIQEIDSAYAASKKPLAVDLYAETAKLIKNRPPMRVGGEPDNQSYESRFEELLEANCVTPHYAADVAVRRGRQLDSAWAEIRSLGVRVQVLQALAIIGWVAAILLALGV